MEQFSFVLQFQIIEKHVGDMLDKLPNLTSECNKFLKQAQEINQRSENVAQFSLHWAPLTSHKNTKETARCVTLLSVYCNRTPEVFFAEK